MYNAAKIKSVFLNYELSEFGELLNGELPGMKDILFIGKREDNDPKGTWMCSCSFKQGVKLAEAIINFMALHPALAEAVIFAVHKYLSINNLGYVKLKGRG